MTKSRPIEDDCSKSFFSSSNAYSLWDRAERSYWDSLSVLHLTPNAVREFDRRNALAKTKFSGAASAVELSNHYKDVSHFARRGGPDLSNIRNHPNPEVSPSPTSASSGIDDKAGPARSPPAEEEEARGSSAYDQNFGRHLIDNYIFKSTCPGKRTANREEWYQALKRPRASLSPSRMSDEYEAFSRAARKASCDKGEILTQVLPKLMGKRGYPSSRCIGFDNLEPLTKRTINARPDYYEGHCAGPPNQSIREKLNTIITPSLRGDAPFLPNFIVVIKDDGGSYAVAERQARHLGALAARGMHCLQSLKRTEAYDGNAYTISAIYYHGFLDMSIHYLTQPKGTDSRPHTHMVEFMSLALRNSPESLCEGMTAIRNASEKANEYREQFIESASLRLASDAAESSTIIANSSPGPKSLPAHVVAHAVSDRRISSEEPKRAGGSRVKKSSAVRSRAQPLHSGVLNATPRRGVRKSSTSSGRVPPRRSSRRP